MPYDPTIPEEETKDRVARSGDRLPVLAHAAEIAAAVREHPVVVVCGETGSGKTTQIPQICLRAGRATHGRLFVCTQPRRIAAVAVAERVAEELGEDRGLVGWRHRFASKTAPTNRIRFVTDGILLAELRSDPLLRAYDTVMVDEAHERTLNVDFLLGCLKRILPRRPDLRVIVSSATLETAAFSAFFDGAPVIDVPGRTYPVEVRWRPPQGDEPDLAAAVAEAVRECVLTGPFRGDVLAFLPGERDIRAAADAVRALDLPHVETLPLYSSLPPGEQRRAFRTVPGMTRVVLATNVAETSVTIPGVRYVVDSGLARVARHSPRAGVKRLHVEAVSRASADQRKGRCGRIGPGVCIRLYDEEDYLRRPAQTDPEIRRASLAGTILSMMDWRLGDIERFPFLQPPPSAAVREGRKELLALGAIRETPPEPDGHPGFALTPLGRRIAKLPLEPAHSRMLFEADAQGALRDALTVVSGLACEDPLVRPQEKAEAAAQAHARFRDKASDFDGMLLLWRAFHDEAHPLSRGAMRRACASSFVSWRRMCEWEDVRDQLERQMRREGLDVSSASGGHDGLHKALLSGLLGGIGVWDDEEKNYKGANGTRMWLFPGSGLAKAKSRPQWIVCAERVDTARLWARRVAAIDPAWIPPLAGAVCRRSYAGETWDGRSGTARALRRTVLYGLVVEDGVRCDISRAKPELCRELFIRHGLVLGELPHPLPEVVKKNLAVVAARTDAAAKDRSLSPDAEIDAFCALWDERLPPQCVNWRTFRDWLSRLPRREADALVFSGGDFSSPALVAEGFPDELEFSEAGGRARLRLPISYKHDPDAEDDGVSCRLAPEDIPLALLFDSSRLVPGALPGFVAWMLRGLPRAPLSRLAANAGLDPRGAGTDALARAVAEKLPPEGPLPQTLVETLFREFGVAVPRDAWPSESVPPAWRWRWVVGAARGETTFATRSSAELAAFASEYERIGGIEIPTAFERVFGRTGGDDRDLLEKVPVGRVGTREIFAWTTAETGLDGAPRPALRATRAAAESALRETAARWGLREASAGATPPRRASPFAADAAALAARETFGTNPPRTVAGFPAVLKKRIPAFRALARDVSALAEAVDGLAKDCLDAIDALPLPRETAEDAAEQLGWLCPPGFAAEVPSARLAEYPRYLEALSRRLRAASADPAGDKRKAAPVREAWRRYAALAAARDSSPPFDEAAAERYRWLVEELRVSVFAQALGTTEPVSTQRLARLWSAITDAGRGGRPEAAPPQAT